MLLRIIFMALMLVPLSSFASTQFRVLVDASGSMLISDPDRLTAESLRLIADLAPKEKTSLGVWLFGEKPRVLLPESLITDQVKESLKNNLGGYVTQDVQTDLESALKLMLDTPPPEGMDKDADQHWILVTDGMVDISLDDDVNKASRNAILGPILDELVKRGIHLHTVSMTNYTDKSLLKTLSTKTNASYTEIAVPDDLLSTFNRIFTMANSPDELPFKGNSFIVDDSIQEFTLLVFHDPDKEPKVIAPDGQALPLEDTDNVTIARSNRYTLVTVHAPQIGTWRVENADLEKSNIRVVTNLKAEASKIAPVKFVNEPLFSDIALFESDELLRDPVILELVDAKQNLIKHQGEEQTTVSEKVIKQDAFRFKNKIDSIKEAGDYELYSSLDGKSFTRKLSQFFTAVPAVNLEVNKKRGGLVAFSVKPTNLRLNVLRSRVMLEITYDNGDRLFEEIPVLGIGFWQKVLVPKSDDYSVRAQLIGVTQTGVDFEYWTPSIKSSNIAVDPDPEPEATLTNADPGIALSRATLSSREEMDQNSDEVETDQTVIEPVEDKEQAESDIATLENEIAEEVEKLKDELTENSSDMNLSLKEILIFAGANFVAFGSLGGLLWWLLRRRKKSKDHDSSMTNDVEDSDSEID